MLDNCQTIEEHWDGVNHLIERWLQERQELIILYCSLSGLNKQQPNSVRIQKKLRKFCQILLDYVSAGHFEVYDQLVTEAKNFKDGSEAVADKLYPRISETTEIALNFNDKYDTDEHCEIAAASLANNLSKIGEILVSRFDWEDQLIQNLHYAHHDQVA